MWLCVSHPQICSNHFIPVISNVNCTWELKKLAFGWKILYIAHQKTEEKTLQNIYLNSLIMQLIYKPFNMLLSFHSPWSMWTLCFAKIVEEMGVLFLQIYCNTMKRVYNVHTFTCNSLCTLHNYRTVTCQTQVIVRITWNQRHFEKNSKYCTVFHFPWILVSGHDSINGVYNLFQHFIQLLCLLWFKPLDILYLLIKEVPLNHLKPLHQFVLNQNKDSLWLWWAKNESRIKTYLSAQLFKFWKNHIRIRNADLI